MLPLIPLILVGGGILGVSAVGLANLNVVNLLLNETEYAAPMESINEDPGESFGLEGDGGDVKTKSGGSGTDAVMQSVQSGLPMSGGKLDLLWLLQNAKDPDKNSYAYNYLTVLANNENGQYNNNPSHASAGAIAGSHYNETKLKTFVAPEISGFGKFEGGQFGKTVNGKVLNLENTLKSDITPSGSGGIYKDNGGDGYPDGPFQIEVMPSGSDAGNYANKQRAGGTFDYVNFVDNLNYVDAKYSRIIEKAKAAGMDLNPAVLNALFGLAHNRGETGVVGMLHGLPYNDKGKVPFSKIMKKTTLSTMTDNQLKQATHFVNEFTKWVDASNIPLESAVSDSEATRGLANLIVMKNGGFIATELSTATTKAIKRVKSEVIEKLYPGMTADQVIAHINKNNVKKPWDALGKSKPDFDKIYGASMISSQYEEIYRMDTNWYNTVFWFDPAVKTDNYAGSSGEEVILTAIEGIAAGYMFDVSATGDYILLKIALEAGIKSLTNGAVVDPSNPDNMYKSIAPTNGSGGSYSPIAGLEGNFQKVLDMLGLTNKLKPPTQAQLHTIYSISGGQYSQPKRGTKDGKGLMYTDCSSMTAMGFKMTPNSSVFTNTGAIKDGTWFKRGVYTSEVNGQKYEAYVYQVDSTGKAHEVTKTQGGNNSKWDSKWDMKDYQWLDVAKPGDIINGRDSSGHVFTYVTTNRTNQTIVLPPELSKTAPGNSTYAPGDHVVMESGGPTFRYDPEQTGLHMRNSSHGAGKSKTRSYQMYRPAYNLDENEK